LSIRGANRAAQRSAKGWISSSWRSASANIWISRTGEEFLVRNRKAAAIQDEAFELPRTTAQTGPEQPLTATGELLVEMGEKCPGQVTDRFGVQKIVTHEAFDRRFAGPVGVTHPLRNFALIVEGETLLGTAGKDVKVAAHRPQKGFGALELAPFRRGQQPDFDQLRRRIDLVSELADPE
jgi:hypothetical protein